MSKDHKGQLTYQQMKQRQIALAYLSLQQNTQLLTQLVRFNFKTVRNAIDFNSLIDIKSIICLIVQKTYFVYTAYLKKTNIMIGLQIFGKNTKSLPQAYSQYLLEIDWCRYSTQQQEYISKHFILIDVNKSHRKLVQYLCKSIMDLKRKIGFTLQKNKSSMDGLIITKQFDKLQQIIQSIILPQIHRISPKAFILCLQQSQLFREYSLLVKCLNNSVFTRIRLHSKIQIQSNLLTQSKQNHQLAVRLKQTSIQQTVSLLLKHNIIGFQQSLNKLEKKQGEYKESVQSQKINKQTQRNLQSKPFLLGNIINLEKSSNWRYSIKFNITQKPSKQFTVRRLETIIIKASKPYNFNQNVEQQQFDNNQQKQEQHYPTHVQQYLAAQQKQKKQVYLVEFTSGKNLLSIKYITNLQMTIDGTDILMFQCNYLTHIWNNVSLQFIQKQNKRYLAFKIISYLHQNERVTFKMLTMVDLLLVYSKATTEYLLRKNITEQHFQKGIELSRQCQQLRRIFISKIEKHYSVLQNSLLKL